MQHMQEFKIHFPPTTQDSSHPLFTPFHTYLYLANFLLYIDTSFHPDLSLS